MQTKVISKPLQHPICPNCGKYGKIEVERRPDGNAKCYDCGFKGKLTNFKRPENKETNGETTLIDIQSMYPMSTITTKSIDEDTPISKRIVNMRLNNYVK